jgi:hypothetical protein
LSIQIRSKTVREGQIRTANKNFELLILLNDNSLTEPERSEQQQSADYKQGQQQIFDASALIK